MKNKLLIGDINDVSNGNYRSIVPRRAATLAQHKFKSIRADEMRAMQKRISSENAFQVTRLLNEKSIYKKNDQLSSTTRLMNHSSH